MKRIVFLSVQAICWTAAFAQPQMGPAGPTSPTAPIHSVGPVPQLSVPQTPPTQESSGQRRQELRSILGSPPAAEQTVNERRLSPAELAQLREQVREQYQNGSQR
ncbi:MAG: hypothetical protein KGQ35_01430 [Burkholderiales bacterium]|nr:hypothetical protein [Burkholderiales bacterium]